MLASMSIYPSYVVFPPMLTFREVFVFDDPFIHPAALDWYGTDCTYLLSSCDVVLYPSIVPVMFHVSLLCQTFVVVLKHVELASKQ